MAAGGIAAMHSLVKQLELDRAIDRNLNLFKIHLPYHESDHVLNIAYNLLAGGTCLEHLELRRTTRPTWTPWAPAASPTRPRRATSAAASTRTTFPLQQIFNAMRLKVWRQQPKAFFEEAVIDADGTMVETTGECKQGMDINYKGQWGYHPLLISPPDSEVRMSFSSNQSLPWSLDAAQERHEVARALAAELPEGVARGAGEEVDVGRGQYLRQGQVARVLLALFAAQLQHVAVEDADDLLAARQLLHRLGKVADRVGDQLRVVQVEVDHGLLLRRVAQRRRAAWPALGLGGNRGGVEGHGRVGPCRLQRLVRAVPGLQPPAERAAFAGE